ncbi:hypothetical protein HK096_007704, partial [Nowakowskiella sp. JEL0078]
HNNLNSIGQNGPTMVVAVAIATTLSVSEFELPRTNTQCQVCKNDVEVKWILHCHYMGITCEDDKYNDIKRDIIE